MKSIVAGVFWLWAAFCALLALKEPMSWVFVIIFAIGGFLFAMDRWENGP